jgi:multidrug resistance protein, MATE family
MPRERGSHPHHLHRRFFRLTLLNILANVTVPLAGLVDVAMLGHLRDIRFLAGVALASLIFDYVYWTFGFLRMGTTGTTAQAVGREDEREAQLVLYRSLALAGGIGTALLLLQAPLRELGFLVLSGTEGVQAAGRDYFHARIWDAPAALANFAFLGWFLGREQSGRALAMTLAATVSNVAFNYLFIVRLGLAAFGAGLGTALSQYVMLAVALALFLRHRRPGSSWREVLDAQRLAALMRLNGDILVRTLCLLSAFALFSNFSATLGTAVLAANTLVLRLLSFAAYAIDGAAFATESLAGVFRGRGDAGAIRRLVRLALATGEGFAAVFLLGLAAAPAALFRLLTSHEAVVRLAVGHSLWLLPVLGLGAVAYVYDGLFLGLTEGRALCNAMAVSFLAFLPLGLLALRLGNNHLLWLALAAFMGARAATLHVAWRKLPSAGRTPSRPATPGSPEGRPIGSRGPFRTPGT